MYPLSPLSHSKRPNKPANRLVSFAHYGRQKAPNYQLIYVHMYISKCPVYIYVPVYVWHTPPKQLSCRNIKMWAQLARMCGIWQHVCFDYRFFWGVGHFSKFNSWARLKLNAFHWAAGAGNLWEQKPRAFINAIANEWKSATLNVSIWAVQWILVKDGSKHILLFLNYIEVSRLTNTKQLLRLRKLTKLYWFYRLIRFKCNLLVQVITVPSDFSSSILKSWAKSSLANIPRLCLRLKCDFSTASWYVPPP